MLPAAVINYSTTMSPKGSLIGAFVDWTTSGSVSRGTVLRKTTANGYGARMGWSNVSGFVVANIRFESPNALENGDNTGGSQSLSESIHTDRIKNATFENLMFWKGAWNSIILQRVRHIRVNNCISYSVNKDAFHTTNGGGTSTDWGVTRDIKFTNCTTIMAGDDSFPVIGYYDGTTNTQPIIEDVEHINCSVLGIKRAHAFRPTGVRGYRAIGCTVSGPPPGYAYTQGPTAVAFGCYAPISLNNSGYPCHASSQVEFSEFFVDGVVWAGSQKAIIHCHNGSGTGTQQEVKIRGRSVNTTPTSILNTESTGTDKMDIEWVHDGNLSIPIRLSGGKDNKVKVKFNSCSSNALIINNGANGMWDIDIEAQNVCTGSVIDAVVFGEGSGTFNLDEIHLSVKITNQTSPIDRIFETLTSAAAATFRWGRFRAEVNFPAMTTGNSLNGSAFSQLLGQVAYGTIASPMTIPIRNTATMTISATGTGTRTVTTSTATFNPSDEGKIIQGTNGVTGTSTITTWTDSKNVTVNTTVAWSSVGPHAAESWIHSGLLPSPELAYWRSYRVYTGGATSPVILRGPHADMFATATSFKDTGITNGMVTCAPGEALRVTWSGGTTPTISGAYISRE
jgi:hypothetical protein